MLPLRMRRPLRIHPQPLKLRKPPLCVRDTNEDSFDVGVKDPINFTIKRGGALVTVRVTIDDSGSLAVKDSAGNTVLSLVGKVDVRQKTEAPTY